MYFNQEYQTKGLNLTTYKRKTTTIEIVLELKFLITPKKMWPGYTHASLVNRLKLIGKSDINFKYNESEAEEKITQPSDAVKSPIIDSQGKLLGAFYSVLFCEKAFRDQLQSTTRYGNFWSSFKFCSNVFFFALVIVLSGGANQNMNTLEVLELFGCWSIMEIAFNRGILASFKYGRIESILGVNLRLIVAGIYSTIWLELLTLFGLLNIWSLYSAQSVLSLFDYFKILACVASLIFLTYPLSYFISILSSQNIDLRFVIPVVFKFIVFTTPLFGTFHSLFPAFEDFISFSPLNLCFSIISNVNQSNAKLIGSYLLLTLPIYVVFFLLRRQNISVSWKIEEAKNFEVEGLK